MLAEPVTLDEAKAQCRVASDDEDALLTNLISMARDYVEAETGLVLVPREVVIPFDDFGRFGLDLWTWPIQEIDSVTYVDTLGVRQTLPEAAYRAELGRRPVRITAAPFTVFPTLYGQPGGVVVTVLAGPLSVQDVPPRAKLAMLMLINHWYDNRSAAEVGARAAAMTVPLAVADAIERLRTVAI